MAVGRPMEQAVACISRPRAGLCAGLTSRQAVRDHGLRASLDHASAVPKSWPQQVYCDISSTSFPRAAVWAPIVSAGGQGGLPALGEGPVDRGRRALAGAGREDDGGRAGDCVAAGEDRVA